MKKARVLIDTWWNVNKIKAKVFDEGKPVLIDTWWNVNEWYKPYGLAGSGFNRYMVECESEMNRQSAWVNGVLIDTWWNVNADDVSFVIRKEGVLIDTWWNVNSFTVKL